MLAHSVLYDHIYLAGFQVTVSLFMAHSCLSFFVRPGPPQGFVFVDVAVNDGSSLFFCLQMGEG